MRKRYQHAYLNPPASIKLAALVRMMIKYEKMHKLKKAPRAIQYRSTWFTLMYARYVLPMEQALYGMCLDHPGIRTFAKGRNNAERAADLRAAYEVYKNPIIILDDKTAFDSSIGPCHLEYVHNIIRACFGKHRLLEQLMKHQLFNRGWTRGGIKYECIGRRMSGDADTALGNSLINYMALKYAYGEAAIVYCDGDDSVVFLPQPTEAKPGTGFKTETVVVENFEDIEFCQCYPRSDERGWIMSRHPLRAMTRMSVSCGKPVTASYATTIGIGEVRAQPGCPGVMDLAMVLSKGGGKFNSSYLEYQTKIGAVGWDAAVPTISAWSDASRVEAGLGDRGFYTLRFNPSLTQHYIVYDGESFKDNYN